MTTKTPILHEAVFGQSQAQRSYQVGKTHWKTQFNCRIDSDKLLQVPRKRELKILGEDALVCPLPPTFDPSPCEIVGITNGGGNNFECYNDGEYTTFTLPMAGTGITNQYLNTAINGDWFCEDFESLSVGAYSGHTPASSTGLTECYANGASIETVTIDGVGDKRLKLAPGGQFAAKLAFGNDWTTLRIAIRLCFDDTGGSITTPRFHCGLLSNPASNMTNGPLTANTSHFFGFRTNALFQRQATTPISYITTGTTEGRIIKRINAVETGVNLDAPNHIFCAGPSTHRYLYAFQVAKGSPNFTGVCIQAGTTATTDVSTNEWLKRLMSPLTIGLAASAWSTFGQHAVTGSSTSGATAVSESDGILNSICLAWNSSSSGSCYISEIVFSKIN